MSSRPQPVTTGDSLVVDVGTGAVKVGLLDPAGVTLALATAPISSHTAPGGVMEQDAEGWWEAAATAVGEVGNTSSAERLVLTGQMQDLTLTDEQGRPLRPTLLYGDVRAIDEAREVVGALGEDWLRHATANDQDAGGLLAKLLWLHRHEPGIMRRASRLFLGAADAIAFRLTGEAACDTTTASTTGLMAFDARSPLPTDAFDTLGLADVPRRMPRLVHGGALVGPLLEGPARAWKLRPGLPIHLAPGDAGAATIGAASGEPGAASGYVGTSGWLSFSALERGDPAAGVFTLAHPAADRTIQIAPILTAGGNLDWAAATFGDGADHEQLIARALARPPARLLYLPYLQGERSPFRDPYARGAFLGLTTDTTRDDMLRAVLEGVCYAYRHALEALVPAPGGETRQHDSDLILSGGGSRSDEWSRLFATVIGRTVAVQDEPESVGLRGALRCVQVTEGTAADYSVRVRSRRFPPDDKLRGVYDPPFRLFHSAHLELRDLFRGLAEASSATIGPS